MNKRELGRNFRHRRIRKRVHGTVERFRLSIYRSLRNMHAQLIDDVSARTVFSLSTQDKNIKKISAYGGNIKVSRLLGELFAKQAKEKGITKVMFDRGGYIYHGRIKAFAEGARNLGLKF